MQYLTYEEYTEIGGTLDLTAFKRNIDRACGFVDLNTKSRLQSVLEVSQMAKACVRDLVEYLANNVSGAKAVTSKSQSAGGVSESESYATKTDDEINAEMLNIVYDYLATETDDCGTPLMYRGAMR
ncbi:MAG: hypothetical protein KIG53_06110 [Oscillospiraceae bacterium]|nr:hypothetical protein [Oscillospiraceae bacterium]